MTEQSQLQDMVVAAMWRSCCVHWPEAQSTLVDMSPAEVYERLVMDPVIYDQMYVQGQEYSAAAVRRAIETTVRATFDAVVLRCDVQSKYWSIVKATYNRLKTPPTPDVEPSISVLGRVAACIQMVSHQLQKDWREVVITPENLSTVFTRKYTYPVTVQCPKCEKTVSASKWAGAQCKACKGPTQKSNPSQARSKPTGISLQLEITLTAVRQRLDALEAQVEEMRRERRSQPTTDKLDTMLDLHQRLWSDTLVSPTTDSLEDDLPSELTSIVDEPAPKPTTDTGPQPSAQEKAKLVYTDPTEEDMPWVVRGRRYVVAEEYYRAVMERMWEISEVLKTSPGLEEKYRLEREQATLPDIEILSSDEVVDD